MKQKKAGISAADEEEIKRKAVEEYLRQQAAARETENAAGDSGAPESTGRAGARTNALRVRFGRGIKEKAV